MENEKITTVKKNENGTVDVTETVNEVEYLATLDTEIAKIQAEIDELSAKKFVKGTQIETLTAEISALDNDITALEVKKAKLLEVKAKF